MVTLFCLPRQIFLSDGAPQLRNCYTPRYDFPLVLHNRPWDLSSGQPSIYIKVRSLGRKIRCCPHKASTRRTLETLLSCRPERRRRKAKPSAEFSFQLEMDSLFARCQFRWNSGREHQRVYLWIYVADAPHPAGEPIHASINQIDPSINQSIHQSINQSTNQSINRSINQSVIKQSIDQSSSQPINQTSN